MSETSRVGRSSGLKGESLKDPDKDRPTVPEGLTSDKGFGQFCAEFGLAFLIKTDGWDAPGYMSGIKIKKIGIDDFGIICM